MTEIDSRLIKCFQAALPRLRPNQIMDATQDSVESWDSIAMATLLTLVGEEFEIPIDFNIVDQLNSYAAIRDYVAGFAAGGH